MITARFTWGGAPFPPSLRQGVKNPPSLPTRASKSGGPTSDASQLLNRVQAAVWAEFSFDTDASVRIEAKPAAASNRKVPTAEAVGTFPRRLFRTTDRSLGRATSASEWLSGYTLASFLSFLYAAGPALMSRWDATRDKGAQHGIQGRHRPVVAAPPG